MSLTESALERYRIIRKVAAIPKADFGLRYFDIGKAVSGRDEGDASIEWQPFQIKLINCDALFASMNKSRQIGASFTLAADGLFDGLTKEQHTIICVSYNLEESKEKIIYANQWWGARHPEPGEVPTAAEFSPSGEWLGPQGNRITRYPALTKATAYELNWDNGFRFISYPCRPPRGKRASVILDELAHYLQAGAIYTAALPMITRGHGKNVIRLASTPLGASGKFWEIHTDPVQYPDFIRFDSGWWEVFDLCTDVIAARRAFREGMPMLMMVEQFGTPMVKAILAANLEEDFMQEYGLQFLDASHAFLDRDLIKSCYPEQFPEQLVESDLDDIDPDDAARALDAMYPHVVARGYDQALAALAELERMVETGAIKGPLLFAYDVGRTRDASEISIFQISGRRLLQRGIITLPQTSFDQQRDVLIRMIKYLPIRRGVIDNGGLGMDLAETLFKRFGTKAAPVTFTAALKNDWAVTLKQRMQQRRVVLIDNRDQEEQLHSIKRRASANALIQYIVEESFSTVGGGKRVAHHADKFWAVALAVSLGDAMLGNSNSVPASEEGGESQARKVTEKISEKRFRKPKISRSRDATRAALDKLGRG